PAQRRLAARLREAVLVVVLEQVHALAVPEQTVQELRLAEAGPGAADVEIVLRADTDERWPRRSHGEVVGVLHAAGDLAGDVLLGVLRADGREQPLQRRDVTRRRRGKDAIIQRHQVRGQRAAAGVAGAAEALRIDLRTRREVIEAANAVPDAIGRGARADEQRSDASHRVFRRAAGNGRLALAVEELDALALADGVVTEYRQAVLRHQDAGALIALDRLAVGAVTTRHQHAGKRSFALWNVE